MLMKHKINGPNKLPVRIPDGQYYNLLRLHSRYIGEDGDPKPQAHILQGRVALPDFKDMLGKQAVLHKELIQIVPQAAVFSQGNQGLCGEIQEGHLFAARQRVV